jgi:hypothetical protein
MGRPIRWPGAVLARASTPWRHDHETCLRFESGSFRLRGSGHDTGLLVYRKRSVATEFGVGRDDRRRERERDRDREEENTASAPAPVPQGQARALRAADKYRIAPSRLQCRRPARLGRKVGSFLSHRQGAYSGPAGSTAVGLPPRYDVAKEELASAGACPTSTGRRVRADRREREVLAAPADFDDFASVDPLLE